MKDLGFYYVLLTFIANMLELFVWKIKKVFTNGFQESLDKSNREPIKIWVDKVSEF